MYWLKIDFYEFNVVQNSRNRVSYQEGRWVGVVVGGVVRDLGGCLGGISRLLRKTDICSHTGVHGPEKTFFIH